MKRLIAAACLLLFISTAYLTGFFYIKNTCDEASDLLDRCITAYENEENGENQAEKLEKFWAKREKTLSFFSNHNEIDEIELTISSLKVYSNSDNKDLFSEYSRKLKTLLHQLKEDTIPNVHSIF